MSNEQLFIRLLHALRDYDEALLLGLMLALGAEASPVRSTAVKLSNNLLGGALSRWAVQRAIGRLCAKGLLLTRVRPKTFTEFSVLVDALDALLSLPLPESRYLPGISQLPISYLAQQRSEAVVYAAGPSAGAAHLTSLEDVDDDCR